ncbi:MAG: sugar transporter [Muribaculaceae bacterium]|nr:sugar transporter [Muribaculaceae bacterium]
MEASSRESRTHKSIKNSVVALTMFCFNIGLQFFSRKIFLDYLGTEVLGLNTTADNLLQFLNLAELGIGSAVAFALFKPLAENDRGTINEIIAIMGWLYRKIAYFIIAGAVLLMFFFPLIFRKINLPFWYTYASFGVLSFSALLGYFVNYRQVLLTADQKEYKIQFAYRLVMIIKVMCQMTAVYLLPNGYIWWLVLEFLFAIISSICINLTVKKTYPYLNRIRIDRHLIKSKYSILVKKIKQLFFHRIGGFVLTQTSPLIIYAYTTLTVVALYGNYLLVTNGVYGLLNAVFNSMAAGVGNLVASADKSRVMQVFRELFSIRFVLIWSLCLTLYLVTPEFIIVWIGKEYLLPQSTLLLMIGIFYVMTSRLTVDAFINGYGLFGDVWSPLVEGTINISLSIFLGAHYGLNGIVCGVLTSLVVSMIIWKPYYLFTRELKGYYKQYIVDYIKHLAAGAIVAYGVIMPVRHIHTATCSNLFELAGYAGIIMAISIVETGVMLLIFRTGLRYFIDRIIRRNRV